MQLNDVKSVSTSIRYRSPDDDVEKAGTVKREEEKMDIFDEYYNGPSTTQQRSIPRTANHRITQSSMYSELTGKTRNAPEPRQPVKDQSLQINTHWRSSHKTVDTFIHSDDGSICEPEPLVSLSPAAQPLWNPPPSFLRPPSPPARCPSPAQEYADALKPSLAASPPLPGTLHWLSSMDQQTELLMEQPTGNSTVSRNNPFRRT